MDKELDFNELRKRLMVFKATHKRGTWNKFWMACGYQSYRSTSQFMQGRTNTLERADSVVQMLENWDKVYPDSVQEDELGVFKTIAGRHDVLTDARCTVGHGDITDSEVAIMINGATRWGRQDLVDELELLQAQRKIFEQELRRIDNRLKAISALLEASNVVFLPKQKGDKL